MESLRDFPLGRFGARVTLLGSCFLDNNIVLLGELKLVRFSGAIYVRVVEYVDIDIQTAIRPSSCGV